MYTTVCSIGAISTATAIPWHMGKTDSGAMVTTTLFEGFGGSLLERSLNVTHGDHEASEHARRESLREAELTHQGVETRVGADRIDEWIEKQECNLRISFVVSCLEPRKRLVLFAECCID